MEDEGLSRIQWKEEKEEADSKMYSEFVLPHETASFG